MQMKRLVRRVEMAYSRRNRARKAAMIVDLMRANGCHTVVFAGSQGAGSLPNSGIVEREVTTAAELVAAFDLTCQREASANFFYADATRIPLADRSFDLVVSNAVIEHVGGEDEQRRMVVEHDRVGRCWVITTPNRWFPVESHTAMPLLHWSAKWRDKQPGFTRLLSRSEFRALLPPGAVVVGRPWSGTFLAYMAR